VKLCTLSDDGATAKESIENHLLDTPQQCHIAVNVRNVSKSCPFSKFFNFGKGKNSQGAKLGE
jgi:hypothetical protein